MDLSDTSEKIPSDTTGDRSRDLPTSSALTIKLPQALKVLLSTRIIRNMKMKLVTKWKVFLMLQGVPHTFTPSFETLGYIFVITVKKYLTLEGPCIIFCNIYTFQRDTQCCSTVCLLMHRCQLYMFRTVTVHPQELLFRCCMCRLWYVVRTAQSDTSRWYNVWGRTGLGVVLIFVT